MPKSATALGLAETARRCWSPVGPQRRAQPVAGGLGVGQGLLGGEGLGDDGDQGGGRIQALQRLGDVGAVDIGGEAERDRGVQRLQRLPYQARAEVRAADADVDDGPERFAARALHGAGADTVGEGPDGGAHLLHLGRNRLALGPEVRPLGRAQGRMHHRPVFRGVDGRAGEQLGALGFHA